MDYGRAVGPNASSTSRPSSVSWFVFVLGGSSAITLLQLLAVGTRGPLTLAFQAALLFQAFLLLLRRPFQVKTPPGIVAAILAMLGGAFIAVAHAEIVGAPGEDLGTSFLFMYSTGLAMIIFLAGPVIVRLTLVLRVFIGAAFIFGCFQAVSDSLLLPSSFKTYFGILYERFVNGRIRVLSFFPSAPRFAELIVFVLTYIAFGVMRGQRRRASRTVVGLLLLLLLYNTFSRSGYLFFVTALFFLLIQGHSELSTRSDGRPAIKYYLVLLGLACGGFYLAFSRTVEDLSVGDTTSLQARLFHWTELKSQFDASGGSAYLLGTGRSAHANILESGYFAVDNVFYAVAFFGGVVGLTTFLWLYWRTLRALRQARVNDPELIPLVALLSALPVEGLFLDNHNTMLLAIFVAIGVLNQHAHHAQKRVPITTASRDPSSLASAGAPTARGGYRHWPTGV